MSVRWLPGVQHAVATRRETEGGRNAERKQPADVARLFGRAGGDGEEGGGGLNVPSATEVDGEELGGTRIDSSA